MDLAEIESCLQCPSFSIIVATNAANDIRPEEEEPNLWEVMDSVVKKAYSEEQDLSNMLNAERAANREAKRIIADLRERLAKYETDAEA